MGGSWSTNLFCELSHLFFVEMLVIVWISLRGAVVGDFLRSSFLGTIWIACLAVIGGDWWW
jgi:hypothetical protein